VKADFPEGNDSKKGKNNDKGKTTEQQRYTAEINKGEAEKS
jgi:hypothetical protein